MKGTNGSPRATLPRLAAGCLALAALSLLLPSSPTYDPWAWIIWGREIVELDLNTREGPSWKPLPVLFTTVFALFGDDAAPQLWLLVGRTGALLALVLCFRLATRLAGPIAGAIAAAGLLIEDEYVFHGARGNSEGILVALALLAVDRHLNERRDQAFAAAVGCALLRPETWPFVAAYGLYAMVREPRLRPWVIGSGMVVLALWFVPEQLGSGDWQRASERARDPLPDSAAFADHPFFETLRRSSEVLPWALSLLSLAGMALVAPRRVVLGMGGLAAALLIVVAAMTQAGYSGNLRYVALPAAFVCVLAGAGAVRAVQAVGPRAAQVALTVGLAGVLAFTGSSYVDHVREDLRFVDAEADLNADLERAIDRAGGAASVRRCGPVYTSPFEVQTLAWLLHLHGELVDLFPLGEGTVFKSRFNRFPVFIAPEYRTLTETRRFLVFRGDCRLLDSFLAWPPRRSPGSRRCACARRRCWAPARGRWRRWGCCCSSRSTCARGSSASASGSTRGCRSASPRATSQTSRGR